jgi:hypothetical protein
MRTLLLTLAGALLLSQLGRAAVAGPAWCPDLKRAVDLTVTKDKFAYIAGPPREGDFRDTTMPLAGWRDCSLYGMRTYLCESQAFNTGEDADKALAMLVGEVAQCLGEDWSKEEGRSSSVYAVLHSAHEPAAMTLGTDRTDDGRHVVRLTLFVRGR